MADIGTDVAAELTQQASAEEDVRLCLFSISGDIYAVAVEVLVEIIIPAKIFPVPTTPAHVLGVISLRGTIVPIVDIRSALSLPPSPTVGQVAIIRHNQITIGIGVDAVSEVISVPLGSVLPLPAEATVQDAGARNRSRFLRALVQRSSGVAALLNIERLLEAIAL